MTYPSPKIAGNRRKRKPRPPTISSPPAIIETVRRAHARARVNSARFFVSSCRVDLSLSFSLSLYFSLSFFLFLVRAFPPRQLHPSLARFSNAWHERHTRAHSLLVAAAPRYKEATLRRAATVSRSSSRRAQKRDPRYSGVRPIAAPMYVLKHARTHPRPSVRSFVRSFVHLSISSDGPSALKIHSSFAPRCRV